MNTPRGIVRCRQNGTVIGGLEVNQRSGRREAVFENPQRDSPRRFVYRADTNDRLTVRLEGYTKGESESTTLEFGKG